MMDRGSGAFDSVQAAWASFIADVMAGAYPSVVEERARFAILDLIACCVSGGRDERAAKIVRGLSDAHGCVVIGTNHTASPPSAALANGVTAAWGQLDEANLAAHQHVSIHVVPPALSLAEWSNASLGSFVRAVIAGYEVSARVGAGTTLREGVHSHGVLGAMGGAISGSLVLGPSVPRALEAAYLVGNTLQASSVEALGAGASVFHAYAGLSAAKAVNAAQLAHAGVRSPAAGILRSLGQVVGSSVAIDTLHDGLGERFLLSEGLVKTHPYCVDVAPAVIALERIMDEVTLTPERVKAVSVLASREALEFPVYVPRTPESARFALPYLLAARIINGPITEDTFAPPVIKDSEILHLARRVSFEEAVSGVDVMSATVTVETSDTGTISESGSMAKATPLGEVQSIIPEKAIRLMTPTLGSKRARQIVDRVTTGDGSSPLRELTRRLTVNGQA